MKTALDWSHKPVPWNRIGPAFAAEVHEICGRDAAPRADKLPDFTGTQLHARMIRAKMTASLLADRVGCSRTTISGLISGSTSASSGLWTRIDAVLCAAEDRQGRA